MIRLQNALVPLVSGVCFAIVLVRVLFIVGPDTIPHQLVVGAVVAGALYLVSHVLRAVRLAAIAMPLAGVSFRTVGLLHLFVAPWSLVLPFKLDEIIRLEELARAGRSWSRAFVAILIDRSMDGVVLIAIAMFLSARGHAAVAGFTGFVGVGLVAITVGFFTVPTLLETTQRYIFAHHYRPRALRLLRAASSLRRILAAGRLTIRSVFPFVAVVTVGIWMLETAAALLFLSGLLALPVSTSAALDMLLTRADAGWRAIVFGPQATPSLLAGLTVAFFLALILCWPLVAFFYERRRSGEPRRSRLPRRSGTLSIGAEPLRLLILHDDTIAVPQLVRQIIGVDRFGEIVKRKQRLGDSIRKIAEEEGMRYVRIADGRELTSQVDAIERMNSNDMIFRLPASLMPSNVSMFARTIRKLPFALDATRFGPLHGDEAPALLSRDDALALLAVEDARERRVFFSALEDRAQVVEDVSGFIDLREVDSFLQYMVGATEARHFNSTHISDGVFRKSSRDKAKMRAEYSFFHVVPEQMKRFLLPTFDYEEAGEIASYGMESLSVPDAALQIVHHTFDPPSFARLMDSFFAFIESRATDRVGVNDVRKAAREEIIGKTERRLDQLMASEAGVTLDGLMRTSGPHGDLATLRLRALTLLHRVIDRNGGDALAVGHGDPCLSNILFNREIGMFRLIDPRGATRLEDAYMHPIYDVAKFSHSILGGYDFVNNGLFECVLDERQKLTLQLENGGPPQWMREAFKERLRRNGFDYELVRAVEMSLFLSMLPLHADVPRKLSAFCLIAGGIIEELEAGSSSKGG